MQRSFEFADEAAGSQRRRARKQITATSSQGLNRATGKSAIVKTQVLSIASDIPMTANELADLTVQKYGGLRETCRKRAMELSKSSDGRLKQVGSKVCRITGSEAAAFMLAGTR